MKTACVTGADRGLGLELTKALVKLGYTVFAGRYRQDWTLLETFAKTCPDQVIVIDLDVASTSSVQAAAAAIAARTDRLDVLVNNAAITGDNISSIADPLDFEEMLRVYDVNAVGMLRVTNALYPLLAAGERKLVVSISSEAGSVSNCHRKGWFAYCASKAAMNMFSAIVHNHLRPLGGKVLVLHPGWMKTWLSGTYRDEGPLTPDIPAVKIAAIIDADAAAAGPSPAYIDYEGNPLAF